MLTEVARHLAAQGVAGRLGGDEFAVWVPGTPERGDEAAASVLRAIAQRVRRRRGLRRRRRLDRRRQP